MKPCVYTLFILAILAIVIPARADSYSDTLKLAGISGDIDGLRAYLKQFNPGDEERKRIDTLIKQLGDDHFDTREAATVALKKLAVLPRAALEKAAKSDDAEIRLRASDVLKSGSDQEQTLLLAAMKVIDRQKHKGLLADIVPAFTYLGGEEQRSAAKRAIAATATKEDVMALRKLIKSDDVTLRAGATAALGASLGAEAAADLKPLLNDKDESVQLAAARALGDVGDRACIDAFIRLLESKQFAVRYEAEAALRWLSDKKIEVPGGDDEKQRAMLVQAWRAWAAKEGATAKLRFPIQLASRIDLFNGEDLHGWQAVHGGERVNGNDVWSAKDGIIHCNGKTYGYLRTKRSFLNYELSLQWRFPAGAVGVNEFPDSGVWLLLSGPDEHRPKAIEAQLGNGNAGDFWLLGGLQCKVDGKPAAGHVQKKAASSEKKIGEWNTMEIRVHQGTLTVKVNGVEQNAATDCPKEPGCIGLQVEGHAVQFRNISLLPLED